MQDRLNQNDVTNRVNVEDADQVRDAVLALFAARYPASDFTPLARAFADFSALFAGSYPGWLPDSDNEAFYEDERYFRPFRRDKIAAGVGQAAAARNSACAEESPGSAERDAG